MPPQLVFDLAAEPRLGRDDFFVTPANAVAVAQIERVGFWPDGKLLLTGPQGSGKSHLAGIWASEHGAAVLRAGAALMPLGDGTGPLVVEDIDRVAGDAVAETELFHLHNAALAAGRPLLMTGSGRPVDWRFSLRDLASRVQATTTAALSPPDDALLAAVLVKLFADRQIAVPTTLVTWLLPRMERSFAAAHATVARLDAEALARRRPVTRALAAEVLDLGSAEAT